MTNPVRAARRLVRRALNAAGYEIVRPTYGAQSNAFDAQRQLLGDRRPLVLDVGGNHGQSVLEYLRHFPGATVHSFEPLPESFATLVNAVAGHPTVRPVQAAVADAEGSRRFHVNRRSSTNSLLATSDRAGESVEAALMETTHEIEVPTITLDAFAEREGIGAVDILKLDIQGGEVMALQGAKGLLSSGRVALVYTEALFAPLYEGQADFWAISDVLRGHGYSLYGLFDMNFGRNGMLAWADALWVRPGGA